MPLDDLYQDLEDAWQNENWRRTRLLLNKIRRDIGELQSTPVVFPTTIEGVAVQVVIAPAVTLQANVPGPPAISGIPPNAENILSYRMIDNTSRDITGGLEVTVSGTAISFLSNVNLSGLTVFLVVNA